MSEQSLISDERHFRGEVASALKSILAQLDEVDTDDMDARLSEGNLAVSFESGGTFVLSQQTPTRELWLSANLRAWHFRQVEGRWLERDSGEPMAELLSRLFSDKLRSRVQLAL